MPRSCLWIPKLCYLLGVVVQPCNQCGKCCLKYSAGSGLGSATEEELELWRENRPDILDYTDESLPDLWISPRTGEETNRCPWLRKLPLKEKYKCRIHDLRPNTCHYYPINIDQMIRDGCEMLEDGDLEKSREELQLELASLRNASDEAPEEIRDVVPSGRELNRSS